MNDSTDRTVQPVSVPWTPDPWPGGCLRLGLITLATDHASEHEVARLLPPSARVYVSRISNPGPCTLDNLRAMSDDITRAASLLLPGTPLQAVMYACTSGTVVLGEPEVAARIRRGKPGVPCTTPVTAALHAMSALGVRRIALLAPYIEEVTAGVRDYLDAHGAEVRRTASFDLEQDIDMSSIPPAAIRDAALALDGPDIDGVFICCTAFRAVEIIADAEATMRKPVITSNQAMAWEALKLAGYRQPVPGYGRLLARPNDEPVPAQQGHAS